MRKILAVLFTASALMSGQSLFDTYVNVASASCSASNSGQTAFTKDSVYTARCNGSAWEWFWHDIQVTPPPTTGWTLEAATGSTVTANADGTVTFYFARRGSVALDAAYRSGSSTQTVTALLCSDLGNIVSGSSDVGNDTADSLGVRDSSGRYESLFSTIGAFADNPPKFYISIDDWTSATSYTSSHWYIGATSSPTSAKWVSQDCHWRRFVEDSSNISHRWNFIGAASGWVEFWSGSKTSFLNSGTHSPAVIGYDYGNGQRITLVSWTATSP